MIEVGKGEEVVARERLFDVPMARSSFVMQRLWYSYAGCEETGGGGYRE